MASKRPKSFARPGEKTPSKTHEELRKLVVARTDKSGTERLEQLRRAERKQVHFAGRDAERERSASASVTILLDTVERDVKTGSKVRAGGAKGYELKHGSKEQKTEIDAHFLTWYDSQKAILRNGRVRTDVEILTTQGKGIDIGSGKFAPLSGRTLSRLKRRRLLTT